MAWTGSGVFNRLFSWATDAVNGLFISSSRMDSEFDNYKTGLENCLTRDGQNQPSANLPMGSFRHTTVGAATTRDQYSQLAQVQDSTVAWGGTAGGTANAVTIAVTPAITAYVAGQTFRFLTGAAANSGAVTLAVNGLTATAVSKENGVALIAADLPIGALAEVVYTGTRFQLTRTSVTSLATDSAVVHLAGTETISGLKTFSSQVVLSSNSGISLATRNTGEALPAGLFGFQAFTTGSFRLLRNTAAAGDFSAITVPFSFGATDAATFASTVTATGGIFSGTVSGADATAVTHFLTKGQVVATMVKNDFIALGTVSFELPPSGWTVTRTSTGIIQVTHNLGTTNYTVVVCGNNNQRVSSMSSKLANSFTALTFQSTTNTLTDDHFSFILVKN